MPDRTPGSSPAGDGEHPDLAAELESLAVRMRAAEDYLHLDKLRAELARLADEVAEPDLWQDSDRARQVTTAYGRVKSDIDELESLRATIEDAAMLLQLRGRKRARTALGSPRGELEEAVRKGEQALDGLELRSLFSGEHDERDAIAEIHGGAGGTDAQDWAEMMLRMYLRWAERRGLEVELDEVSPGGEAGILSATFIVRGRFAYGLLTAERGVHRLVRMSPFDAQHRRQTSFASFDVTPFLDELAAEVEIDEKDCASTPIARRGQAVST